MTAITGSGSHLTTRLVVAVDRELEEFRARYELEVPIVDEDAVAGWIAGGESWETVVADTAAAAPHGFLRYFGSDVTPVMRLAGNQARCVHYLMGNHTIAERMYRHDPAVMIYAPLRLALYSVAADWTRLVVDQPSTHFASFGVDEITTVGLELDQKLAALIESLGAPVPAELTGLS
jgi:hypothetical protein